MLWVGNVPAGTRGVELRYLFDRALKHLPGVRATHARIKKHVGRECRSGVVFINQAVRVGDVVQGLDVAKPGHHFIIRKCRNSGRGVRRRGRMGRRSRAARKFPVVTLQAPIPQIAAQDPVARYQHLLAEHAAAEYFKTASQPLPVGVAPASYAAFLYYLEMGFDDFVPGTGKTEKKVEM